MGREEVSDKEPEGFDTKVHHRDPKSGRIIRENHYRLTIHKGNQIFERNGRFYWGDGKEILKADLKEMIPDFPFPSDKEKVDAPEELKNKKIDVKKLAS